MRRDGIAIVILGLLGMPALGGEIAGYPRATQYGTTYSGTVTGVSRVMTSGGCGSSCDASSCDRGESRFQKLCDFLLYRPIGPCNCRPEVAYCVPPLTAWFPNKCHAHAGCGKAGCSDCAKGIHSGGCASCGTTLGTPPNLARKSVQAPSRSTSNAVYAAQPRVMPKNPQRPMVMNGQASRMPFAPPPVTSPYAPAAKPATATTATAGYRIQPTGYTLPQR